MTHTPHGAECESHQSIGSVPDKGISRREFLGRAGGAAIGLATVGAILPFGLSGCSTTSSHTGVAKTSAQVKTAAVGVAQVPDTLDPGSTDLLAVSEIAYAMFDPLVWGLPGGVRAPGLAEKVVVNPDATEYTLYLRKGVKFADGTPFTASAVKATFDHIVSPSTRAGSAIGYLGPYASTEVVSDFVAKVKFKVSYAAFYSNMTSITLAPSSPSALAKYGRSYGDHPVGTGPFAFVRYLPGNEVVVRRNPYYSWGPSAINVGPAHLPGITFRILTDAAAQASAFATGELQIATNLGPGQLAAARSSGALIERASTSGMPWGVELNVSKTPTNELAVRRALVHATDADSIVSTLFDDLVTVATGLLTPGMLGYISGASSVAFNPSRAEQILDEAGWRRSGSSTRVRSGVPLEVKFVVASNFGFSPIAELMATQFETIGVASTITKEAFPAVQTVFNEGQQNLNFWFFTSPDPSVLETVFSCSEVKSGGYNWSHYCSPNVSRLLTEADAISAPSRRAAVYEQIETTIYDQAIWIPIRGLDYNFAVDRQLRGVAFSNGNPVLTGASYA